MISIKGVILRSLERAGYAVIHVEALRRERLAAEANLQCLREARAETTWLRSELAKVGSATDSASAERHVGPAHGAPPAHEPAPSRRENDLPRQAIASGETCDQPKSGVRPLEEILPDVGRGTLMSESTATTLLPSAQMMFRVGGDDRPDAYLQVGTKCFADIQAIATDAGRPLDSFASVLDYGCGCGRVLRHWPTIEGQSVHGTDIDGDAVEWCRTAMPTFAFNRNGELPPTAYDASRFDLIYSVSVFSHLRPDYAKPWVAELKRIAAPGALLIISLHGSHLLPDESGLRDGLLFQETEFWSGHFPEWYGNLYVSEVGARQFFNSFDVINFIPRGMANHQDVIVLRA